MSGFAFLSYSRADREYVDQLVEFLRNHQVEVWVDHDIDYGDRWAEVIQRKIDDADVVVVALSGSSVTSNWVDRELNYALDSGKTVLPLRMEKGIKKLLISNVQYEDVVDGRMPSTRFVERLRRELGLPPLPPPPVVRPQPPAPPAPAATPDDAPDTTPWWRRRAAIAAGVGVAVLLAGGGVLATQLGGKDSPGVVAPISTPLQKVVIAVDLPYAEGGDPRGQETFDLMSTYLASRHGMAGDRPVELKPYDTGAANADCATDADKHVAADSEVAVIGTFDSECAKAEVPILNAVNMVLVSHVNRYPGLTTTWEPGEPDKYYPHGNRTYARVQTTQDKQGDILAKYAGTHGLHSCYVLNDGTVYGQTVAANFLNNAHSNGVKVEDTKTWMQGDAYANPFPKLAQANVDCVVLAGQFVSGIGNRLVHDKVVALGNNEKVKLLTPDGFAGDSRFAQLPDAQLAVVTYVGVFGSSIIERSEPAQRLVADYQAAFHTTETPTGYAFYGVAALQVVLGAIEASDGTRDGVREQLFGAESVTVPAAESVLGKEIHIDSKTGDCTPQEFTFRTIVDSAEGANDVLAL